MIEQIKKLKQLAIEITDFAVEIGQEQTWITYTDNICVYLANNNSTRSVQFYNEKIEVALYSNNIHFDMNFNEGKLDKAYDLALIDFERMKNDERVDLVTENEKQRLSRINALELELENLKKGK